MIPALVIAQLFLCQVAVSAVETEIASPSDTPAKHTANLAWSMMASGDTTFAVQILRNEFADGGRFEDEAFPLGALPLRHVKIVRPADGTSYRATDLRAECRICWLGVSREGEIECRITDPNGSSIAVPGIERRLLLAAEYPLPLQRCSDRILELTWPGPVWFEAARSRAPLGWMELETSTRHEGMLINLTDGSVLERFDSLGTSSSRLRGARHLILCDFLSDDSWGGPPFRTRYRSFEISVAPKVHISQHGSTAWLSDGAYDPDQIALSSTGDGVIYFADREESLAVLCAPLNGGSPLELGVVPFGQPALADNGGAFVLMTEEVVMFFRVGLTSLVPVWTRPRPPGTPMRLEMSPDGCFIAAHLQRGEALPLAHDLYVWDSDGCETLRVDDYDTSRDRLPGLEFIGSTWLMEGAQFNETANTRLVNLYKLPE